MIHEAAFSFILNSMAAALFSCVDSSFGNRLGTDAICIIGILYSLYDALLSSTDIGKCVVFTCRHLGLLIARAAGVTAKWMYTLHYMKLYSEKDSSPNANLTAM